jgi:hypothetical protein
MPAKVVLHIGFHNTGMSTAQQVLRGNRALLKPHLAIRLKPQMTDLLHATRGYPTWRDKISQAKVACRLKLWRRSYRTRWPMRHWIKLC